MPFKSDKQRRFLWSQKPEVAKQIAYKQSGGGVYSSGIYDDAAKWHNARLAGVPQHVGFVDDPDDITETAATNPDDPYGGKYINPDRKAPLGRYTDLATYYTAKDRKMGRGEAELARMSEANRRLREEAKRRGFVNDDGSLNFQHGGEVPMTDGRKPKKVTQKDRYGNSTTVEYDSDTKPLDINSLVEMLFDKDISAGVPVSNVPVLGDVSFGFAEAHPGAPKGSDTVPAWLTPGEFVVNREAMSDPAMAKTVEAINDKGRMMQQGGYAQPSFQEWLFDTGYDEELARGTISKQGALLDYYDEFGAPPPVPEAPTPEAPAPVKSAVQAAAAPRPRPQAQGGVDWNVPLGSLGGIDFSTQGSYTAMDQAKDPYKVGLRAALKFNEGGPVYMDEGGLLKNLWWLARNQDKVKAAQEAKAARAARKQAEAPQPTWADLQSMIQGAVQHKQEGGNIPVPMSPTEALLRSREGYRSDVYLDSEGKPTVGHGHLLPNEYISREGERPFSEEQLDDWFREDQAAAKSAAQRNAKHYGVDWDKLNKREKTALESMAFQLGETGQKGFEKMWKALAAGDKETAALEALDSDWASQTPERAKDVYSAFTPGLGFERGGPVYAYRGYGVAEQDAYDIEDPNTDLSSGWTPPVFGMDEISPMEQNIINQEAQLQERNLAQAENMVAGGDGDDLGSAPTGVPPVEAPVPSDSEYQQRLAQQIAMAENMVAGGDGDDLGSAPTGVPAIDAPVEEESNWWDNILDWSFGEEGTAVADKRNAANNVKVAEANADAAVAHKMEVDERIAKGQPVSTHAKEMAEKAVEHSTQQHKEAVAEAASLDLMIGDDAAEEITDDLVEANKPGPEDDEVVLKDIVNDENMANEDNPEKASEKGQQHPPEVIAKGEEAVKEDPSLFKKAEGFFKGAFDDLFDKKELARMAMMYVGSRALGYSHGGSLNWAAKQYVSRVDAKQASRESFIKTNAKNFTPKSLDAYRKTGDLSTLEAVGKPDTITGNVKTRISNGKKEVYQEIKRGDNTLYKGPDGAVYTAAQLENSTKDYHAEFDSSTPEYRTRRSRATKAAAERFEGARDIYDINPDSEDGKGQYTKIPPKKAAQEFWSFMESKGYDPESDEALAIMTNAYQSAIADAKGGIAEAHSLKPYLESEYIRETTGAPEVFITNPEKVAKGAPPTYVRDDKFSNLLRNFDIVGDKHGKSRDEVFQKLLSDWQGMDEDQREPYGGNEDESPFYNFAQQNLQSVFE